MPNSSSARNTPFWKFSGKNVNFKFFKERLKLPEICPKPSIIYPKYCPNFPLLPLLTFLIFYNKILKLEIRYPLSHQNCFVAVDNNEVSQSKQGHQSVTS